MYVIREFAPYSRAASYAKVQVHGITMGVYDENEQPVRFDEGEREQSVTYKWANVEDATAFLRQIQRLNGVGV